MINQFLNGDNATFFIAEIGLNHNGDLSSAKKMIELAASVGADAVKFQVFDPRQMNSVYTKDLLSGGQEQVEDDSLVEFFKGFVLSEAQYMELKNFAEKLELLFFASVFDFDSLEMLERIGVTVYKLASSEVTNLPLIKKVALTGKPLILSTGMATDLEIEKAIAEFNNNSNSKIAILHCVSLYPIDDKNVNIKRISSLREKFDIPVGFSDHTPDTFAASLAALEGARIFEKHFTIDRNFDCPDKVVSLIPSEFSELITNVERAIEMSGHGEINFGKSESETAKAARRSLFATKDIVPGAILKLSDLKFLRPGIGIPIYEMDKYIGRKVKVNIRKDFMIRGEYFE